MPLIEVTISELQNAASKISQSNTTFREAAANLKAAADALSENWEGDAHDAFIREQEQINKWYALMAEAVDGFVASINQAAVDYNETDIAAAQLIRSN